MASAKTNEGETAEVRTVSPTEVKQAEWEAICGKSCAEVQEFLIPKVQAKLPDGEYAWETFMDWKARAPVFFSDGNVRMFANVRENTRGCGKTRYMYEVEYDAKGDSGLTCTCIGEK
mmetsp:Transcript_16756/g.34115  ORF Transcript_16756/g.34115 Transcript_16756/m.34115 type:complete len:117 (+) Transcript_16756:107-457(+)